MFSDWNGWNFFSPPVRKIDPYPLINLNFLEVPAVSSSLELENEKFKKISEGSFSEVFLAELDGRLVAIKQILQGSGGMRQIGKNAGERRQILEREISVHWWLSRHPETGRVVVPLQEYFWSSALTVNLVMPYHRASLLEWINDSEGVPSWEIRYKVMQNVVNGVSVLHAHGVAHGDIKPDNILMDGETDIRFCDFGAVNQERPLGTIGYLAPEFVYMQKMGKRWCGRLPDPRKADVFALAVVLFTIAEWGDPWDNLADDELRECVESGEKPEFSWELIREVPALVRLISDAWQNDPALRPTAASMMLRLVSLAPEFSSEPRKNICSYLTSAVSFFYTKVSTAITSSPPVKNPNSAKLS